MRVMVTGAGGMLGREVVRQVEARNWEAVAVDHARCDITQALDVDHWLRTTTPDVVVNCAGIIPERSEQIPPSQIMNVNARAPWLLAEQCAVHDARLIHVSTDCVFDGTIGGPMAAWWPQDAPNARDLYGRSKAAGEPWLDLEQDRRPLPTGITTVRTSFIGPDHGLWRWYVNATAPVKGYRRAYWSGSTVDQVAKGLLDLIVHPPTRPIVHLAANPISKGEVLQALRRFGGGPEIEMVDEPRINRRLAPTHGLPEFGPHLIRNLLERSS